MLRGSRFRLFLTWNRPTSCGSRRWQSGVATATQTHLDTFDDYDAQQVAMYKKRKLERLKIEDRMSKWFRGGPTKTRNKPNLYVPEGSNDEILRFEVTQLLANVTPKSEVGAEVEGQDGSEDQQSSEGGYEVMQKPKEFDLEVEVEVISLSSTGDGLALNEDQDHVFVIPYGVPGDIVRIHPNKWFGKYTTAEYVDLIEPSPSRGEVVPACPYFTECSGCQLQMLPYEKQLEHKREIVQRAFKNFSGLKAEQIPEVDPTMPSPLQYGYRTKLTPHFQPTRYQPIPNIGFNIKGRDITGRSRVLDIETCPIGTDILQEGLKRERVRVIENIKSYRRGATILLRERTHRSTSIEQSALDDVRPHSIPKSQVASTDKSNELSRKSGLITHDPFDIEPYIKIDYQSHTDTKMYTADNNSNVTEYVTTTIDPNTSPPTTKTYTFTQSSNSFFQNNNSILGDFTSYIYSIAKPPPSSSHTVKYLLDAYSGSGLFTLTLSSHFKSSLGIDLDVRGIEAARLNAANNNIENAGFIDADASNLFADVPYPASETVVVIDPPRKGCDREFLKQLRTFGPRRVIYVSCNVHSQARDVGVLVNGFRKSPEGWFGGNMEHELDETWEWKGLSKYKIESLRGCDFFPQTGHVEGVCVLNRVD